MNEAELMAQRVRQSRLQGLTKLADLVDQRADQLGRFLTEDPAGRQVPLYLRQLDHYFRDEQKAQEDELRTLRESVEHIKEIVAMQQTYARSAALVEKHDLYARERTFHRGDRYAATVPRDLHSLSKGVRCRPNH